MLRRQCRSSFDPIIKGRGEEYFRSGRVISYVRMDLTFDARVRGSDETYDVFFDFEAVASQRNVLARCSCPYYQDGDLCKHIWAVLLKLDAEGITDLAPPHAPLSVLHEQALQALSDEQDDEAENEEESQDDFEDFEDLEDFDENSDESSADEVQAQSKTWMSRIGELQKQNSTETEAIVGDSRFLRRGAKQAYYSIYQSRRPSEANALVIEVHSRELLRNGGLGVLKSWKVSGLDLDESSGVVELAEDREILSWLLKIGQPASDQVASYRGHGYYSGVSKFVVDPAFHLVLLPRMAATERLLLDTRLQGVPLEDDSSHPWELELIIHSEKDEYHLEPRLFRNSLIRSSIGSLAPRHDGQTESHEGKEVCPIAQVLRVFKSGFILFENRVGRLSRPELYSWIHGFQQGGQIRVPKSDAGLLVEMLLNDPTAPRVIWPAELQWSERKLEPRVRAVFSFVQAPHEVLLELSFEYPGISIPAGKKGSKKQLLFKVDAQAQCVYSRNFEFESQAGSKLEQVLAEARGQKIPNERVAFASSFASKGAIPENTSRVYLSRKEFAPIASRLVDAGFEVLAQGRRMRISQSWEMKVSSGVNWFDLAGRVDFGEDVRANFPELLAALKRGDGLVELGDGSVGVLPSEWLSRYAPLAKMGQAQESSIRFQKTQGLFLDAWLSDEKNVEADQGFQAFQKKVREFEGIPKKSAPRSFCGKLRPYQKEGLAWFGFVEEFKLGGILADDMGLGKTVQLLAFLLDRHSNQSAKDRRPHLVIAPKSLAFNWMEEARRFAPKLKVINYTGKDRSEIFEKIHDADLVITTYPVIRADIEQLKALEFDVAVVDEAQAIKNPKSQGAAACKLLKANHRFAMTGTPIENSLGDLFSILDFTSPGLLEFATLEDLGEDSRQQLARALRPVILRRTKANVLKELPEKTEQTIYCEMSPAEQRRYQELRIHYRNLLQEKIGDQGLGRAKIHVLEALLRLRQVACHPGLVDPSKKGESSAKLDNLFEHLREVLAEGHKALVFSQFTKLLKIVESRLKEEGICFEYLDGKTEDRQQCVDRFQNDPACQVFLISLKAGGTGLNLTSASYVFLLDPWWNPAVEAQAIDRAHRIGQVRKVFAYRMIAQGTVEEKILELQKSKRELADSIIAEDSGFLRRMTKEDLEFLLS